MAKARFWSIFAAIAVAAAGAVYVYARFPDRSAFPGLSTRPAVDDMRASERVETTNTRLQS